MTQEHVFGSDQLDSALLRNVRFTERDGMYDAAEVRSFLDRVASSLDVFMAQDAPAALRAEFARNAEIAQQVLEAGQAASEQLRRQAAEEARTILDETREATLGLRQSLDVEIAQSRAQVEQMRERLIGDLRDLYDRIGASLYRFERAAEEDEVRPIAEPQAAPAPEASPPVQEAAPMPEPALEPEPEPDPAPEQLAPAWQQLPAEAWGTAEAPPAVEPFLPPVEDEPLAPGEPLVDLREFGTPAAAGPPEVAADDGGSSWLDAPADAPVDAPAPAAMEPVPQEVVAQDDALAEALIAGTPFGEEPPPAAPAPQSMPDASPAASPDAVAVRQLILDSLAQGQSREVVEAYLRDQMGFMEPAALVDAALADVQ